MCSTTTFDIPDIDGFLSRHPDSEYEMAPGSLTSPLVGTPQVLGNFEYNNEAAAGLNHFDDYIALLSNNPGLLQKGWNDGEQDGSAISDRLLRQPDPSLMLDINAEIHKLHAGSANRRDDPDSITSRVDSSSPASDGEGPRTTTHVPQPRAAASKGNPRRQNHSCDQCRSSKKACDLPLSICINQQTPSPTCTTCNIRGLECTVAWLASKKSEQHAKKRLRTASPVPEMSDTGGLPDDPATSGGEQSKAFNPFQSRLSLQTVESDIVRQLTARKASTQHFNLYIDVCDMPLTQCLLQGSMPPRYSMGLAALAPLSTSEHLAAYSEKANGWIKSCWEMSSSPWSSTAVAPHAFRAVSFLDSLFQEARTLSFSAPGSSRDASINETYKWVAIATAAQYATDKSQSPSTSRYGSDLAVVTWRKAREMVFKNLAATGSFRQSLSLMFFGFIIRPNADSDETDLMEEDANYALCEGIPRLHSLCVQARSCIHSMKEDGSNPFIPGTRKAFNFARGLPCDVQENVLELIGAIEWLANIANVVLIAITRGDVCPMPVESPDVNTGSAQMIGSPGQSLKSESSLATIQNDQEIYHSFLQRANAEEDRTLVAFWQQRPSDHELKQEVRHAASLEILLWKSLASLILRVQTVETGNVDYGALQSQYETTMKLVGLWRSTVGAFDGTTIERLEHSPDEIRRMVAFCVNDGDLAVLLFYDTAQRLETDLGQQPSAPAKDGLLKTLRVTRSRLTEQRLLSARQISTIALVSRGLSSPRFQGHSGLKAYVQDTGAHPVSSSQTASCQLSFY